jgi:hypothetical protein
MSYKFNLSGYLMEKDIFVIPATCALHRCSNVGQKREQGVLIKAPLYQKLIFFSL